MALEPCPMCGQLPAGDPEIAVLHVVVPVARELERRLDADARAKILSRTSREAMIAIAETLEDQDEGLPGRLVAR